MPINVRSLEDILINDSRDSNLTDSDSNVTIINNNINFKTMYYIFTTIICLQFCNLLLLVYYINKC